MVETQIVRFHAMKQARIPKEAELKRLLAIIAQRKHAERNRIAIMLSYYGGLRVGEIASLRASDIIGTNGDVKDQIVLRAETTKANESRTIYVNDRLMKELIRYVSTFEKPPLPNAPFLKTQKNTAFSPNSLCQLLGNFYEAAGIDGGSSHSGRRWFISKLAHSGISPKVIMTLAGHKNLATTQRYIEVSPEMMRAAVGIL